MKTKLVIFFQEGIWQQQQKQANKKDLKTLSINYLKVFILSAQGFIKDNGALRASALTLYTLLSIVPIIAMCFGIAKGFGFEATLEQYLLEQEQDSLISQLLEMAKNMLESTKGGVVAGFGVALLFWTVLKVISNIEDSFNHIWKVKKARTLGRKLGDYLSLMLFAPILIVAANSINIFAQVQLAVLINTIALPGSIFALQLLSYLPIIILWLLFSFIFIFMPNTQVTYKSGIFSGVITGTTYYIIQSVYIYLQVGVSSYNAIYGSFAALPLFLVWLQITWIIMLFGSELSYYHQNLNFYHTHNKFQHLNFKSSKAIALIAMQKIITRFQQLDLPNYTTEELSVELNTPINIIQKSLDDLIFCQLLTQLTDVQTSYQPSRSIELLNEAEIINALENKGENYQISSENK
jgi:membrane protein